MLTFIFSAHSAFPYYPFLWKISPCPGQLRFTAGLSALCLSNTFTLLSPLPPLCLLQALSWSCLPRWFFYFYSLCFSVFSTARQSSEMFHSLCHPFCSSAHMIFVGAHWVVMLGRTFQGSYLVVPECLYKRNWHDNLVGREGLWLVLEWTFITSTSFLLPL
jgi:hypothetical protein